MFKVILSPEAEAFFTDADRPLARKLSRCFAALERDPRRQNNIKRLSGKFSGFSRYCVGDWRVIYRIDDGRASLGAFHRKSSRGVRMIAGS
jgi:mRNA-degrading endonuclease RelE of RelBE toxin-antitoxin system